MTTFTQRTPDGMPDYRDVICDRCLLLLGRFYRTDIAMQHAKAAHVCVTRVVRARGGAA